MAAPRSALEPVEDDDTAWAAAAAALGNAGWAPKREHLSDETTGGLVLAVRAEFDTLGRPMALRRSSGESERHDMNETGPSASDGRSHGEAFRDSQLDVAFIE